MLTTTRNNNLWVKVNRRCFMRIIGKLFNLFVALAIITFIPLLG
jgi:hypothetical protein